jgi:hypothetical protein
MKKSPRRSSGRLFPFFAPVPRISCVEKLEFEHRFPNEVADA